MAKVRDPIVTESGGEKQVFGPDIIKDAEEQVKIVRENPRVARYAYKRRRDLTFEVNDFVYPKVSPMRGIRIQHQGKVSSRGILDHSRCLRRKEW
ncbi:hypothetical protein U9M48_028406 [Paspalum notatum var. saurae]|uniref:Uncharacterized protein n=1 Tax=Paspalum notatum var. saurae TaxID=547442 RepID=A0AAQ3TWQ5_PASNO